MGRFEGSRGGRDSRRSSRGRYSGRGGSRDRDSGPKRYGRNRRDRDRGGRRELEMTKVICSDCGDECEVPFKPTSSKPVYCSDCFLNNGGKSNSGGGMSGKDFDMINEKLDKIMVALKIR